MTFSRRAGGFLLGVAVWSWVIWPTFLRNIANDPRAFSAGAPTGFFVVHLVLTVVSLALGTGCGVIGWRALRRRPEPPPAERRRGVAATDIRSARPGLPAE